MNNKKKRVKKRVKKRSFICLHNVFEGLFPIFPSACQNSLFLCALFFRIYSNIQSTRYHCLYNKALYLSIFLFFVLYCWPSLMKLLNNLSVSEFSKFSKFSQDFLFFLCFIFIFFIIISVISYISYICNLF